MLKRTTLGLITGAVLTAAILDMLACSYAKRRKNMQARTALLQWEGEGGSVADQPAKSEREPPGATQSIA